MQRATTKRDNVRRWRCVCDVTANRDSQEREKERKGGGEGAPLFICVMSEPPLMKSVVEAIEIEIDNNNKKAKRNRNRIQNQERERETGRGACRRQMASLRFPSVFNINFHCLAGLVYCVCKGFWDRDWTWF